NRPGYGTKRGICYDRHHHCVWDYGTENGTSTVTMPGSQPGLWKGAPDLKSWEHIAEVKSRYYSTGVAYDEHARKVGCHGEDRGLAGRTWIYYPDAGSLSEAKGYASGALMIQYDPTVWPGLLYAPALKGCLHVANPRLPGKSMGTLLLDANSREWHDLAPNGP